MWPRPFPDPFCVAKRMLATSMAPPTLLQPLRPQLQQSFGFRQRLAREPLVNGVPRHALDPFRPVATRAPRIVVVLGSVPAARLRLAAPSPALLVFDISGLNQHCVAVTSETPPIPRVSTRAAQYRSAEGAQLANCHGPFRLRLAVAKFTGPPPATDGQAKLPAVITCRGFFPAFGQPSRAAMRTSHVGVVTCASGAVDHVAFAVVNVVLGHTGSVTKPRCDIDELRWRDIRGRVFR